MNLSNETLERRVMPCVFCAIFGFVGGLLTLDGERAEIRAQALEEGARRAAVTIQCIDDSGRSVAPFSMARTETVED